MRATFQDRDTAALMGVDIGRIYTATFALGSGLAAAAGALLGPVFVVDADHGRPRRRSRPSPSSSSAASAASPAPRSAASSSRFVEEMGAGYVSSGYRDAMGFLLIILILLSSRRGCSRRKERIG